MLLWTQNHGHKLISYFPETMVISGTPKHCAKKTNLEVLPTNI